MNAEQQKILTSLDTNMGHVLETLRDWPDRCDARAKRIGAMEIKHGKIEERVETHNKFIWGTVISSIGSIIGLVFLGIKMLLSNAFMVK